MAQLKSSVQERIDALDAALRLEISNRAGLGISNFTSTVNPTVTDDSTAGYAEGSRWLNMTAGVVFTCIDATPGAAKWIQVSGSGSSTGNGASGVNRYTYTVTTSNKTVLTAADLTPAGFSYTPGSNALVVHIDGVYQQVGSYTETSATAITFSQPLPVGSTVEVTAIRQVASSGNARDEYVSTAADGTKTIFTGADFTPTGFAYQPGLNQLEVIVGGVPQPSSAYTETDSTTITFTSPPPAGASVRVLVYRAITLADAIPINEKAQPNGVATLDSTGKLVQMPTVTDIGAATLGDISRVEANIALNAFRLSATNALSLQHFVDGIVDEYADETGIDTVNSSGQRYNATGHYYDNLTTGQAAGHALAYTAGYMNNTPAANGSSLQFTISTWIKWDGVGLSAIIAAGSPAYNARLDQVWINANGTIYFEQGRVQTSTITGLTTSGSLTPNQYHHLLLVYDSSNANAANRFQVYIDGVLQTLTGTQVPLNQTTTFNQSGTTQTFSQYAGGTNYAWNTTTGITLYDTYMVDGLVLAPSDFTQTKYGSLQPLTYNGSYGALGYHLDYATTAVGTDAGPNGINFTPVGMNTATQWVIDNPSITSVNAMTLLSTPVSALSSPTTINVVVLEEDIDAIVLGTDLTIDVSRDGGATWTAVGSLAKTGSYNNNTSVLQGTASVGGQPNGTSIQYRVNVVATKALRLHGVSISWK
ncbi:hypothetical protein D6779_07045 [Candidatus Parcubacteria bacterium]|nr:MAG: hypothetical protein D6779_07045 [Candidatus Parcubacteria bacterium]